MTKFYNLLSNMNMVYPEEILCVPPADCAVSRPYPLSPAPLPVTHHATPPSPHAPTEFTNPPPPPTQGPVECAVSRPDLSPPSPHHASHPQPATTTPSKKAAAAAASAPATTSASNPKRQNGVIIKTKHPASARHLLTAGEAREGLFLWDIQLLQPLPRVFPPARIWLPLLRDAL